MVPVEPAACQRCTPHLDYTCAQALTWDLVERHLRRTYLGHTCAVQKAVATDSLRAVNEVQRLGDGQHLYRNTHAAKYGRIRYNWWRLTTETDNEDTHIATK